jgi:hypothetical protein
MPIRKYCSALGLLTLAGLANAQAIGVSSTFDIDTDGWFISDYLGNGNVAANWITGVIQTDDQFSETSFHAPTKFNGDWSALYASTLSFDLTEVGRDAGADAYFTAIIASGSSVLYWYGGAPTTVFTTFVAPLSASDSRWRLGGTGFSPTSGVAPTEAQFRAVLSNITRLQINAEFITGTDNTRLDNVILGAVPEPQTYYLLAAGLVVLGKRIRAARRKA